MDAKVQWIDNMKFIASSASGHSTIIDASPDIGGENLGMRPMEMILLGTGGCSSIDIIHILKKSRQDVSDCVCQLQADRADTDPKVFTKINMHFIISGNNLNEKQVGRAVKLSAEKYCSASIMLQQACEITHSFEII